MLDPMDPGVKSRLRRRLLTEFVATYPAADHGRRAAPAVPREEDPAGLPVPLMLAASAGD